VIDAIDTLKVIPNRYNLIMIGLFNLKRISKDTIIENTKAEK
jgi:hypothetical protein